MKMNSWITFLATFFLLLYFGQFLILKGTSSKEIPLTQIPHIARFARNPQVAQQFSRLAEFSIRLLQWKNTDKASVIKIQKWLKNELYQQTAMGNQEKTPALPKAIKMTNEGYWSLKSPHLFKIAVGNRIQVVQRPEQQVSLLYGQPCPLPVILKNTDLVTRSITLRLIGFDSSESRVLSLAPGQVEGLYLTLFSTTKPAASSLALEMSTGKRTYLIPLKVNLIHPGKLVVRVVDENNLVTPARIYLTGSDGRSYQPIGGQERITNADYGQPFGGDYYFYSGGSFEVMMPPKKATLEVVKGFEYAPISKQILIVPNQSTEIEIRLKKPVNFRQQGWFSGDTHVHPNVYNDHLIRPSDVLLIAKAEDLNLPHLLTCNDVSHHINDRQYFQGRPNNLSEKNYILYWNQEMRAGNVNNHVGYLGLKKLVQPAFVGWPNTPFPYDFPPNYEMGKRAKEQGAVVTYVHPGLPSQYPVDIALGAADMIDVMCQRNEDTNTQHWYHLLNCGFKCPISAGTDSFLNTPYHLIPGAGRVYVQVGSSLTYDKWIKNYRSGYSFATNFPLLKFSVNGKKPGEEIHWESGQLVLEIKAEAYSHIPMERMDLIVNGQIVSSQKSVKDGSFIRMTKELSITDSGWLAVRVHGKAHRLITNDTGLYAHSSPVYCYKKDKKVFFKKSASFFINEIDKLIETVRKQGIFRNSLEREKMIQLFQKGQNVYRNIEAKATR